MTQYIWEVDGTDTTTIIWISAIVVFVVVEALTVQLICIWFALSALVTMIVSLLGAPLWAQLTVFPVCTVILLLFTRPAVKKLMKGKLTHTNADRILGMPAVVVQEVNNDAAEGQVKVMNQIWTARSLGGDILPRDAKVTVRSIEGVKVIVEKVQ